jgi:tetratricopeptide (TPR) repeat protein
MPYNSEENAVTFIRVRMLFVALMIAGLLPAPPCHPQRAARKRDTYWNPAEGAPEIIRRARQAYEERSYERALQLYQEALETVPEQYLAGYGAPNIHFDIGTCYAKLGRYREAIAAIEKSNSLYPEPDYMATHCAYLGMIYSRMEDYARSEEYWQKATERDPTQAVYFAGLANNSVRLGHYDKAQEAIDKGLRVAALETRDYFTEAQLIVHLAGRDYAAAHRIAGRSRTLGASLIDAQSGAVQVNFVFPGGPAHLAGLAAGDVVESLDGNPVRNLDSFDAAIAAVPFASTVEIRLKRNGAVHVKRFVAGIPANLPELAAAAAQ